MISNVLTPNVRPLLDRSWREQRVGGGAKAAMVKAGRALVERVVPVRCVCAEAGGMAVWLYIGSRVLGVRFNRHLQSCHGQQAMDIT